MPDPLDLGLVTSVDARGVWVDVGPDRLFCSVRGRFYETPGDQRRPIAPGDRVRVLRTSAGEGAVEEILPRRTKLSRPAGHTGRQEQVIAANVDQMAIVAATAKPRLRPGLVDRLIVAAVTQGIEPFVVLNKIDLGISGEVEEVRGVFASLGYAVILTSAVERIGIAVLAARLAGRITVFAGHSGVGKSSLLNAIDPGFDLRTGAVSDATSRGRHVTTRASLLRLPGDAYAVDTPGVRAFGLWDLGPGDLQAFFSEFPPLAERCRFRDCRHDREPACAVRAAAEAGEVSPRRYASYLRILASLTEAAGD